MFTSACEEDAVTPQEIKIRSNLEDTGQHTFVISLLSVEGCMSGHLWSDHSHLDS